MNQKKYPPFGREVSRILQAPEELVRFAGCTHQRGTVWVATGPDSWEWKKSHPRHLCIVLPEDTTPTTYKWAFLCGHEPILLVGPEAEAKESRREIAAAMVRDGVTAILAAGVLINTPRYQGAAQLVEVMA